MRSIPRYIGLMKYSIHRPSTQSVKWKCYFYKVDISMDCTNFKDYICYIILKLTKCQINLLLLLYFTYTFLQHFHYNLTCQTNLNHKVQVNPSFFICN